MKNLSLKDKLKGWYFALSFVPFAGNYEDAVWILPLVIINFGFAAWMATTIDYSKIDV